MLGKNLRTEVWKLIKTGNPNRKMVQDLIGCDFATLKAHLESKFTGAMTWENYTKEWEVDHIIPVKLFNLLDMDERRRCFHYTNLQPLHPHENSVKSDKVQGV